MNNRYICKAKRKDNGEWVEGYYACQSNHSCLKSSLKYQHFIYRDICLDFNLGGLEEIEVIPETVGQCTTLTDKNGKLIFTGDILHIKTGKGWACPVGTDIYYEVVFTEFNEQCDECTEYIGFMADNIHDDEYSIQYLVRAYGAEVVGNVYDNPDLLEVER